MSQKGRPDTEQRFMLRSRTPAEEEAYNYVEHRVTEKPVGFVGSVAHIVKGALGGGILGGHVAWKMGGIYVAIPMTMLAGMYMTYCLYVLVKSAQTLYRRARVPTMTYPDIGEAALACHTNPSINKHHKKFRYMIDAMICIDLFGTCSAYQIIISKSIKQLVENTPRTSIEGLEGMPGIRFYLAIMILPIVLICLIRYLKWLAPLSVCGNVIIVFCIILAIYHAFEYNPNFQNMVPYTSLYHFFEYIGTTVFSMSCVGVVIPCENNMKDPRQYGKALLVGMFIIVLSTFSVSFFGYAAFLEKSESPITVNFPLNALGKTLKACIIIMIYVTHALNFWVPFDTVYYYMKKRINPDKVIMWEYIYRAIFVTIIGVVAIIFPKINALMGFLGAFCLSNLAFIYPNIIHLLVVWERPGLGKFRWRLGLACVLIVIGIFFGICGTYVNTMELINVALHS